MTVIQMSISAAVLIAAIIIVRMFFSHRLPQKTFLVLWGVAVCRLLLPISIPSKLSIFSCFKHSTATQVTGKSTIPGQQLFLEITGNISAESDKAVSVLTIIWVMGVLLLAAYFVLTHMKCRRIYKMALPIHNRSVSTWQRANYTKRNITIKQCDQISSPFTYRLLRPIILLPKTLNLNDTNKLCYVLTHEYAHIKHFDIVKKYLLVIALCVHWFNPLVWVMYFLANRDIEISCDQSVVRNFGSEVKSDYANALILMEESRRMQLPLCNNFSSNATKERIVAIMKMKKFSAAAIIGAVVLIGGMSAVFATSSEKISIRIQPSYVQMSDNGNSKINRQASTIATYNLVEGSMGEHNIPVGETAIYSPINSDGLLLMQGDKRTISFAMVDREFDYGQGVHIGYILDGNRTQLFEGQIKRSTKVKLKAPTDGNYSFYVECASSDPLLVEMVSVT